MLQNERVAVPEILFHPSDIGMKEGGVVDAVIQAIEASPECLRPSLYNNILVTGGTAKLKGFVERLRRDLRTRVPNDFDLNVNTISGIDSALCAWRGGSKWASSDCHDKSHVPDFKHSLITKEQYEELGHGAMERVL